MVKRVLFVLLFVGSALPVWGESLDEDFVAARKFHQAGDFERAFALFKKCAEGGHCGCMNSLGNYYLDGAGVEANTTEAIRWHRRAFETGAACGPAGLFSALSLARIYAKGLGIKEDHELAREWCKKALDLLNEPKLSRRLGPDRTAKYRKRIGRMLSSLR